MSEVHDHPHEGSDNPGGHYPDVPEQSPGEGSRNPGPNLGGEDEEIHSRGSGNPELV